MNNKFQDLQVGCKIKTFGKFWNNVVGIVTEIVDWSEHGPLTNENHGSFTVIVEETGNCDYLEVGDEEHFCYVNWQTYCEIIE